MYKSPTSYTDSNYQTLYRTYRWTNPPPAVELVPASSDPRGYFKSGTIPSKIYSYRVLLRSLAIGASKAPMQDFASSPLGGGFLSAVVTSSFSLDFYNCRFKNRFALVLTNGKDIIDLPTEGLVQEGNVITLPDNVLRLIHAGDKKLIPDKDTRGVSYWSSLAVNGNLEGNLAKGVKPKDPVPDLLSSFSQGNSLKQSDTTSNQIIVAGKPNFVSYVTSDKPVFRDVVSLHGTALVFGINSQFGFETTSVSPGSLALDDVQRFAYVNKEKDPKKPQQMGWRMSESFGYTGSVNQVKIIPQNQVASLSEDQKRLYIYAESIKWYAYDLNSDDGIPYNVSLAQLMMDPTTKFYKSGFKAIILEQDPKEIGYGRGIVDWHAVEEPFSSSGSGQHTSPLKSASGKHTSSFASAYAEYYYTSPIFNLQMTSNSRLGQEYYLSQEGGIEEFTILTKTSVTAIGMSILYDPATSLSMLVESSPMGALERMFDDFAWTMGGPLPTADKAKLQLGEYPFRSKGQSLLVPQPKLLKKDDKDSYATDYTLKLKNPEDNTFRVYTSEQDTEPLFEISAGIWANKDQKKDEEVIIGIPPTQGTPFVKEGGGILEITNRWGAKAGDIILPAQTGDKNDLSDRSEFQVSNIYDLKFPIKTGNLSNALDPSTGLQFLAYEYENRIDLAVRTTYKDPFSIIRDIVLRINAPGDTNPQNMPTCSNPSLIMDISSKCLLLFYVYKSILLVKRIPFEIFLSEQTYNYYNMYSPEVEKKLIKSIHSICPTVVMATTFTKASFDLHLGKIKVQKEDIKPSTDNKGNSEIDQYCISKDKAGYFYAFIQSNDKIIVKTSSNLGSVWATVVSENFSFYPARPDQEKDVQDLTKLSCPFVLYDEATDVGHIFYVIGQTLMCLSLSMSPLRNTNPKDGEEETKPYVFPRVVFGPLTRDMVDRKITKVLKSKDGKRIEGNTANQKITGFINKEGYYRIFLKDTNDNTRSLISNNQGTVWYEDSYFATPIVGV